MKEPKKLFIANLPKFDCSEEGLLQYFNQRHPKKYGTIESIQLIKKKDADGTKLQENKGFGFVMVSSEDLADKMAIQHATFEFGGRKVELKKSVPTNEGRGGRRGGRGGGNQMQGGMAPYGGGGYDYWGYGGGYGGGYAGYDGYGYGGWGGGYGAGAGGNRGGRGGGRGGRFQPY